MAKEVRGQSSTSWLPEERSFFCSLSALKCFPQCRSWNNLLLCWWGSYNPTRLFSTFRSSSRSLWFFWFLLIVHFRCCKIYSCFGLYFKRLFLLIFYVIQCNLFADHCDEYKKSLFKKLLPVYIMWLRLTSLQLPVGHRRSIMGCYSTCWVGSGMTRDRLNTHTHTNTEPHGIECYVSSCYHQRG